MASTGPASTVTLSPSTPPQHAGARPPRPSTSPASPAGGPIPDFPVRSATFQAREPSPLSRSDGCTDARRGAPANMSSLALNTLSDAGEADNNAAPARDQDLEGTASAQSPLVTRPSALALEEALAPGSPARFNGAQLRRKHSELLGCLTQEEQAELVARVQDTPELVPAIKQPARARHGSLLPRRAGQPEHDLPLVASSSDDDDEGDEDAESVTSELALSLLPPLPAASVASAAAAPLPLPGARWDAARSAAPSSVDDVATDPSLLLAASAGGAGQGGAGASLTAGMSVEGLQMLRSPLATVARAKSMLRRKSQHDVMALRSRAQDIAQELQGMIRGGEEATPDTLLLMRSRLILTKPPSERTDEDAEQLYDLLCYKMEVEFFKKLPREIVLTLCRTAGMQLVQPGDTLFRQGERGSTFYVVLHGSVTVWVQRQQEARAGDGDSDASGGGGGGTSRASTERSSGEGERGEGDVSRAFDEAGAMRALRECLSVTAESSAALAHSSAFYAHMVGRACSLTSPPPTPLMAPALERGSSTGSASGARSPGLGRGGAARAGVGGTVSPAGSGGVSASGGASGGGGQLSTSPAALAGSPRGGRAPPVRRLSLARQPSLLSLSSSLGAADGSGTPTRTGLSPLAVPARRPSMALGRRGSHVTDGGDSAEAGTARSGAPAALTRMSSVLDPSAVTAPPEPAMALLAGRVQELQTEAAHWLHQLEALLRSRGWTGSEQCLPTLQAGVALLHGVRTACRLATDAHREFLQEAMARTRSERRAMHVRTRVQELNTLSNRLQLIYSLLANIVHHYLCYVEPARAKVLLQPLRAHKAHLGHQVAVLSKGDYFGDLALFAEDSKRTATIVAGTAAEDVELIAIDKAMYDRSLRVFQRAQLQEKSAFLASLYPFQHWHTSRLLRLAYRLRKVTIPYNTALLHPDRPVQHIYFVLEGQLRVSVRVTGGGQGTSAQTVIGTRGAAAEAAQGGGAGGSVGGGMGGKRASSVSLGGRRASATGMSSTAAAAAAVAAAKARAKRDEERGAQLSPWSRLRVLCRDVRTLQMQVKDVLASAEKDPPPWRPQTALATDKREVASMLINMTVASNGKVGQAARRLATMSSARGRSGNEVDVAVVGPGEAVGVDTLLFPDRYGDVTVRAATEVVALQMARSDYERFVGSVASTVARFAEVASRQQALRKRQVAGAGALKHKAQDLSVLQPPPAPPSPVSPSTSPPPHAGRRGTVAPQGGATAAATAAAPDAGAATAAAASAAAASATAASATAAATTAPRVSLAAPPKSPRTRELARWREELEWAARHAAAPAPPSAHSEAPAAPPHLWQAEAVREDRGRSLGLFLQLPNAPVSATGDPDAALSVFVTTEPALGHALATARSRGEPAVAAPPSPAASTTTSLFRPAPRPAAQAEALRLVRAAEAAQRREEVALRTRGMRGGKQSVGTFRDPSLALQREWQAQDAAVRAARAAGRRRAREEAARPPGASTAALLTPDDVNAAAPSRPLLVKLSPVQHRGGAQSRPAPLSAPLPGEGATRWLAPIGESLNDHDHERSPDQAPAATASPTSSRDGASDRRSRSRAPHSVSSLASAGEARGAAAPTATALQALQQHLTRHQRDRTSRQRARERVQQSARHSPALLRSRGPAPPSPPASPQPQSQPQPQPQSQSLQLGSWSSKGEQAAAQETVVELLRRRGGAGSPSHARGRHSRSPGPRATPSPSSLPPSLDPARSSPVPLAVGPPGPQQAQEQADAPRPLSRLTVRPAGGSSRSAPLVPADPAVLVPAARVPSAELRRGEQSPTAEERPLAPLRKAAAALAQSRRGTDTATSFPPIRTAAPFSAAAAVAAVAAPGRAGADVGHRRRVVAAHPGSKQASVASVAPWLVVRRQ